MDSSASETPCCRVCHGESEPNRELFFPCKCDGSIKYVHQDCLMEWLKHTRQRNPRCELCGTEFKFKNIYRQGAPLHLTILDFVSELIPRVFDIIRLIVLICLSCFFWALILPLFTNLWFHYCWCLITEKDVFSCANTIFLDNIFSFEKLGSAWYSGVVNLCMIFILSVFAVEMGRIIYKVMSFR
jgi:E3 ubiquitin-protein ligase DOA10